MDPIVAAVPKAVPVKKDTRQFNTKQMGTNNAGRTNSIEKQTMVGIVPHSRHSAVRMPIKPNEISTFRTVAIPFKHIKAVCLTVLPFFNA